VQSSRDVTVSRSSSSSHWPVFVVGREAGCDVGVELLELGLGVGVMRDLVQVAQLGQGFRPTSILVVQPLMLVRVIGVGLICGASEVHAAVMRGQEYVGQMPYVYVLRSS